MNKKHTSGEWKVSGTSIVTNKYCIAVLENDGGHEAPAAQRNANAVLLSAAPNLLKAAQIALYRLRSLEIDWAELTDLQHGSFPGKPAMKELEKAIAKATGGVS